MYGTTPPCETMTLPRSLFSLGEGQHWKGCQTQIRHVLLVVPDGELKVTGHDTLLLVVTSRVTGKLKNLSCKVLKDRSEVDYVTNV